MKTLTPTPEKDPKDSRRDNFRARNVHQDHGTRGTENPFVKNWRHYEAEKAEQREGRLGRLIISEQFDEALTAMSPAQIEKAANGILQASASEIDDALSDNDLYDAMLREELEYEQPDTDGANDATEGYIANQDLLRLEISGVFERGKAVNADPNHMHEGVVDEGHADYLSGFHITDRP